MPETTKKQIIKTAYDLFSQYGIKSVSMDDIARNTGLSKRTLYEEFSDKEELLLQGLVLLNGQMQIKVKQFESENHSALDTFLLIYDEMMKNARWYTPKFYDDMKRYPNVQSVIEAEQKEFAEKCRRYIARGVEEGELRPEVNIEIIALLAKEQIHMMQPSRKYRDFPIREVYNTVLLTFLRGICTEQGREKLERYAAKQLYFNQ